MSTLASVIIYGLFASRPAFGIAGRLFFASDTLELFYDTGAAWQLITTTLWVGGATGSRPATPIAFQTYFDTTLNKPIWYNGTNWVDSNGTSV